MNPLPSPEADLSREELIVSYHPLVRTIACRMARRLPPSVDVDELINVGMLGLIDAVDRFDPERGVPFKSYAEIRIQGSMIDALRNDDWVPRSVRRKSNRIEDARITLTRSLGRDPSRNEMARSLGASVDEYDDMVRDARITRLISLDVSTTDDGRTPLVESITKGDDTPEEQLSMEQLKEMVTHAVNCLPEKERVAVTKYYLQGLTLRQIGAILGVTESRACQLRGQGIKRLKFRLRHAVH
ncbi:MAG: RNA polymerase sigma factor FliA [Myxococcota bacterium]